MSRQIICPHYVDIIGLADARAMPEIAGGNC